MRAYLRGEAKRRAILDTLLGLEVLESGARKRRPTVSMSPGTEGFALFARGFEQALTRAGGNSQRRASLANCQRLDVVRIQRCGEEQPRAEAWCGQPHCTDCARRRATEAVRYVRRHWLDMRVGVAQVPIGRPGGLELPSPEGVASVRAAWARATKLAQEATSLPRVESVPRTLVTPDGLVLLFVRPAGGEAQEQAVVQALEAACREIGLRDVAVTFSSRESAALRAYRAVLLEAERFHENVLLDVERIMAFPRPEVVRRERALRAAARRWLNHVKHRQESSRRQTVLGSKTSLPFPARAAKISDQVCGQHGASCTVERVVVRDQAQQGVIVWRSRGNPFSARPTRQALATFCARVTDKSARHQNERTQILWRAAG